MKHTKKMLISLLTVVALLTVMIFSASACTMVYVGSDLTSDGSSFMARSEDYSNMYNKVAYVSPAGNYKQGEVYEGCYGFTFEFTHDTYAYTATSDDNLAADGTHTGVCPNCGKNHKHTPMEENGCNEKGVSVSAMVTLSGNSAVKKAEPMVNGGMCESDMTTILLSEAATAKEGVDLLIKIYDTVGAEERSGVLIGDQKEIWYVENYTGHQYIAVKLSSDMIAISPNMGAIGLVDLDDTENVIASEGIISVAKTAETFVGDEAANTIDFRASYSNTNINARMINGINYLAGEQKVTGETVSSDDFTISNVKDGEIVTMYSNITTDRKLTVKDMVDFYKVDQIGNTSNLEWHIFQIKSGVPMETGTIQWLAMENGQYTVAIPYLPVLTTDMYEGYKVGGVKTSFVTEEPGADSNPYFAATDRKLGAGFKVFPDNWAQGYYWSVDALSNYCLSSKCTAEENANVKAALAVMQAKCYTAADEMVAAVASMSTEEAQEYCTAKSAALAKEAHELTVALYNCVAKDVHSFENGVCSACGAKEPFEDVTPDNCFYNAVVWAVDQKVTQGTAVNLFEPGLGCSRAMAVTFLYRLAGSPEVTGDCPFVDVNADDYFYNAVMWAIDKGITFGCDETHFCPDETVTRAQLVTFLYRFAGSPAVEGAATFTDIADADDCYLDAIAWAQQNKVANGHDDGSFKPNDTCCRWDTLLFIYNFVSATAAE